MGLEIETHFGYVGSTLSLAHSGMKPIGESSDRELVPATVENHPQPNVLEWVLNKIVEVSSVMGLSFEGLEEEVLELFSRIEQQDKKNGKLGFLAQGRRVVTFNPWWIGGRLTQGEGLKWVEWVTRMRALQKFVDVYTNYFLECVGPRSLEEEKTYKRLG